MQIRRTVFQEDEVLKSRLTSVGEEKGYCSLNWGLLVDEVNIQATEPVYLDGCSVVGELVDLGLGLSPIVNLLPVLGQAFDVGQRSAIVPSRFIQLIGEVGDRELLGKPFEGATRDGDSKGLD